MVGLFRWVDWLVCFVWFILFGLFCWGFVMKSKGVGRGGAGEYGKVGKRAPLLINPVFFLLKIENLYELSTCIQARY